MNLVLVTNTYYAGGAFMASTAPIGFFDSGVGGISVLKKAMALLPQEDFVYFGDSIHAPYGDKDLDTIKRLSFQVVEKLMDYSIKAIVVACNTATSAAIEDLRSIYPDLPVIGIEPALKVAVDHTEKGNILVLATKRTLEEKKFKNLLDRYKESRSVETLPLPGLVEIIEEGGDYQEKSYLYLKEALKSVEKEMSAVVLGCTHYPFIKPSLRRIYGEDVLIVDGSEGTARHLKEVLAKKSLLTNKKEKGALLVLNSSPDEKFQELSLRLLEENSDQ